MPRPQARVFVLNTGGHNFDAAKKYTSQPFIAVTTGRPNIFDISGLTLEIEKVFRDHAFSSDDYLLIAGSPVLAALAMAILKETFGLDQVNVLIFHAGMNEYLPRRIDGLVNDGVAS